MSAQKPLNDESIPRHLTPKELQARHRLMSRIRAFELTVEELFNQGRLPGLLHSCVGQEASAAGIVTQLRVDDYVLTTHRGHGHCLAKGADPGRMMAELYGRVDGYCRGKGGSMHVCDLKQGLLGANGIVGAGLPIAAGVGTAIALRGSDQVVACFFGDGAANEGGAHEGLNLASLWDLPVIYVCENNQYAQYTHQRFHTKTERISDRASSYKMPGLSVDGNDLQAVHEAAHTAIDRARSGAGPTLIECLTYRWTGHSISNPGSGIGRPEEELELWKARDPVRKVEQILLKEGIATEEEFEATKSAASEEMQTAVKFAVNSPEPEPEAALDDVYVKLPEGALI